MSSGELLIILMVALIVFGPKKLPMLASHLGLVIQKTRQLKSQMAIIWQQQLNELQLHENRQKAKEADKHYSSEL